MALIECPKCGRRVSSLAESCPGCAYPIAERESKPQQERNPPPLKKVMGKRSFHQMGKTERIVFVIVMIILALCLIAFAIVMPMAGGDTNSDDQDYGGTSGNGACRTGYSPAVNDQTKCCPTGYPYYWSSDGKCHTTAAGNNGLPTPTHTLVPTLTATPLSTDANSIYREYEWSYEGSDWTWTLTIPKSLYEYFRGLSRASCSAKDCDYSVLVTNSNDDSYITSLVDKIKEAADKKGYSEWETINFAVTFVQSLPYTYDNVSTPYDNYPRYPIETLADNGGDCEDTAILMAAILDEMGYGVIMIYYPGLHYAVGVLGGEGVSGTYFSHNGGEYYYLETTGMGWKIGQQPSHYKGMEAYLYDVVPKPKLSISSWQWSTPNSRYYTLTVPVKNGGTAAATGVYIKAGFDAGSDTAWNWKSSDTFAVAAGGTVTVTLSLEAPPDKYTRVVVQLMYNGYAVTTTYSDQWFTTY